MMGQAAANEPPESGRSKRIVVVLLAAGAGSRFEGPNHKLTVTVDGRSVAERALTSALAAEVGPVVVVTGSVELTLPAGDGRVDMVHNPDWASGQSSSLAAGLRRADELGADAVVVGLADQPFIDPEAWRLVAGAASAIAVATYDGARRNPVKLDRSVWSLLPAEGDEGARSLIRLRTDLVQEVPCPGSPDDIDTLEDLRTWQNRSSTSSP
jgi:molybdenum cofactor cytidylyltransferase